MTRLSILRGNTHCFTYPTGPFAPDPAPVLDDGNLRLDGRGGTLNI